MKTLHIYSDNWRLVQLVLVAQQIQQLYGDESQSFSARDLVNCSWEFDPLTMEPRNAANNEGWTGEFRNQQATSGCSSIITGKQFERRPWTRLAIVALVPSMTGTCSVFHLSGIRSPSRMLRKPLSSSMQNLPARQLTIDCRGASVHLPPVAIIRVEPQHQSQHLSTSKAPPLSSRSSGLF